MEVMKSNLHMLETGKSVSKEKVLESEVNLEQSKPDLGQVYLPKAKMVVEELQPLEQTVLLRGYVQYRILYFTKEEDGKLVGLEGRIPVEESLALADISRLDELYSDVLMEDFSVLIVNPRKLVMRLAMQIKVWSEEIKDAFVSTDIKGDEGVEKKICPVETASLFCCKRDMLKIRREVPLPEQYPEIDQTLWSNMGLEEFTERCEDGIVKLSGRLRLQFLYQGMDLENGIGVTEFDTTVGISEVVECLGCRSGMIPCCSYHLENETISILPNKEGEQRVLLLEASLCLRLKVYEICQVQSLCNAYGTQKELQVNKYTQEIPRLIRKITGRQNLEKKVTTSVGAGKQEMLQLLCYDGQLYPLACERQEETLLLRGFLEITVLLVMDEDEQPFFQEKISLPYEYRMEVDSLCTGSQVDMESHLEGLHVEVAQNGILDIHATSCFTAIITEKQCLEQIEDITEAPIPKEVLENLPDMMILRVGEGEDLWSIGKKYYVTVEELCKQNHLESPEVSVGQKLMLLR